MCLVKINGQMPLFFVEVEIYGMIFLRFIFDQISRRKIFFNLEKQELVLPKFPVLVV